VRGADRPVTQIDWLNTSHPNDSPPFNKKPIGPGERSRNATIARYIPGKIIKKRKSPNGDTVADAVGHGNPIATRPGARGTSHTTSRPTISSKTLMTKHDANLENAKSKKPISTRTGVGVARTKGVDGKTRYTDLEGTGGNLESGQQKVSIDVLLRVRHESP
jgi:hypothetical protein